jgi:hypothetical protein
MSNRYEHADEATLCRAAIDVQDACNLTGVVYSFADIMRRLRMLHPTEGTDFFNHHHVAVMFSSKIADMTGSERDLHFSTAYRRCREEVNDEIQLPENASTHEPRGLQSP